MNENRKIPQNAPDPRLPLRGSPTPPRRTILASHLIFTAYAHWLPNDPRGSGSSQIRNDDLKPLGDILPGRQYPQPPREIVRQSHRQAEPLLDHPRIWFSDIMRLTIASAFADAAKQHGYTLWACAILSNHAHIVARTHRDRSEIIWSNLAHAALLALRGAKLIESNHPLWSHRPYKVFLYTPQDVLGRINYVNENPIKEKLPRQEWAFVKPCPFGKG
jgi:REP element-mobilizing transposase RayT